MKLVRLAEHRYVSTHLCCVRHITLDPKGPGVIRVHMVPPGTTWSRAVPYLLILNGKDILPIGLSWAIMFSCFMDQLEPFSGKELANEEWSRVIDKTITRTLKVYPAMSKTLIEHELETLLNTLKAIAQGKKPEGKLRIVSLSEYAPHMTAPHRMDLMISAMSKGGCWNCNQRCLHCYAAGQPGADTPELNTAQWKSVIAACRKACIPQLTFTGGEPTLREDLVELIQSASWFITRLNTNGRLLTPELCKKLYDADLDSVQVTLYSHEEAIHNQLVGVQGFQETVAGIQNAVKAGLSCSVNTPLCALNSDYPATLGFLNRLGVRYVTCSGLIPSGNALETGSRSTALSKDELKAILEDAVECCQQMGMEISFTSPGWLTPEEILKTGLKEVPSCGACLSNMAVQPDGTVIPCQSWLSGVSFGNLLTTPWKDIWNHPTCVEIRQKSAATDYRCQLPTGNGKGDDC